MKNIKILFFLFFTLTLNLSSLQAQAWYVYDGSIVPDALSEWTISSYNPGQDFVEDIITDSHISGNKFLRYLQANEIGADFIGNARKYYRHDFVDANPEITIIARQKCIAIDSLSGELGFVMEISDGPRSIRDALLVSPDDSTLKLQRAGNSIKVNANLFEWHLYRMTFNALDSTSTIYFDENITAVLTGKTTSNTSSNYFRFGDGGSPRVAGYTDWIIIDTTGAYNPADGAAIPDSCSTATGPQISNKPGTGYNLVYVTKTINKHADGYYADSMNVANLVTAGFNVTIPDYTTINTTPFFTAIDAADIVVIGSDVTSPDFQYADQVTYWEKLQKPVILMNAYVARDNRLKWLPSGDIQYYSTFGNQDTKVELPADAAFSGVAVPSADSIISYCTDNILLLNIYDSVRSRINGTALTTFINGGTGYHLNYAGTGDTTATLDMSIHDGMPLMIRWAPITDSMYSGISNGAVAARPLGWRTYLPGGDNHAYDYNLSTRKYAYDVFSDAMKSVIVNEAVYLLTLPVPDISDDNTLDTLKTSVGTMDPAFSPTVFSYTIDVPEGTTSVTITAVANNSKAKIDNAGVFVLPFDGTDTRFNFKVTSEAGSIQSYSVLIKKEIVTIGNVIPGGIGTIEEYLAKGEYEEYILINGEKYVTLEPIIINNKITLKSQDPVRLPLGNDMPMVVNDMGVSNLFVLDSGAAISLIGIDFDGNSSLGYGKANRIIATGPDLLPNGKPGYIIENIYINRCKMHNVSQAIVGSNLRNDSVTIKNITFMNSYVYDSDGRGVYIKDFYQNVDVNPYVFKNITYWNLGQQFNWIQILTPDVTSKWVYDHITGYNIGTNGDKELWGNSEKNAKYEIQFSNIILSEQTSSYYSMPSLYFTSQDPNSVNGVHSHDIHNLVLHNVNEVKTRGVGERGDATDIITMQNIFTFDPQFADPTNGDFTIGNTDYLTAGDNGTVLGALYWAPNFVDDFSDLADSNDYNSQLDSILVDGKLIEGYNKDTLNYFYIVEKGKSIPAITYAKLVEDATVVKKDATNLNGTKEERTTTLTVTSKNELTESIYSIEFYTLSSDATLSDLTVNGKTITGFDSKSLAYTYDIVETAAIPKVNGTPTNDSASVKIVPVKKLNGTVAERTALIIVKAENKSDSITYSVQFIAHSNSIDVNNKEYKLIYPTVVENELFINHFEAISQVEIISLSGKSILVDMEHTNTEKIDVSFLQAGIYIIKLQSESGIYMDRFIKE